MNSGNPISCAKAVSGWLAAWLAGFPKTLVIQSCCNVILIKKGPYDTRDQKAPGVRTPHYQMSSQLFSYPFGCRYGPSRGGPPPRPGSVRAVRASTGTRRASRRALGPPASFTTLSLLEIKFVQARWSVFLFGNIHQKVINCLRSFRLLDKLRLTGFSILPKATLSGPPLNALLIVLDLL